MNGYSGTEPTSAAAGRNSAEGGRGWHEGNAHDGRRDALTGGYRRATPGAGCGGAAAGAPRLSRGDRARAAPAESVGRAVARCRLLPDGDPARAGRLRGRPADLPACRGAL